MRLHYVLDPELDVAAVAALRTRVDWDARKDQLERILGSTYMTAACFDGNSLVGIVDVISDGIDDAFIRNLIIDPDYHRKGIALKLLTMVVDKLKADQIKTVNVLFEKELTDLYRKAGFRIVKGGIIDNEEEGF